MINPHKFLIIFLLDKQLKDLVKIMDQINFFEFEESDDVLIASNYDEDQKEIKNKIGLSYWQD